jgi:hypothetical protein
MGHPGARNRRVVRGFPDVVLHEGAEDRGTLQRDYGLFGALHFTGEAEESVTSPGGIPGLVLGDIADRATCHTETAHIAFLHIHFEQPALDPGG